MKAFRLGFRLLAIAALAAFTIPAQAINFSYTENGTGKTMALACNDAVQRIADHCDSYGAITTDPGGCFPVYNAEGQYIFDACFCKATTTYCYIYR